jgi:hypothetical protein
LLFTFNIASIAFAFPKPFPLSILPCFFFT